MALTKGIIFKRLQSAKNFQQNVETMSAWILHHVKCVSTISRVWFDVYVGANDELKITLIYVMNDVLQKARKLQGDLPQKICTTFHFHLRYAILISSEPVKQKVRRVVGILATRHVISKSREEELNDLLDGKIVRIFPPDLKILGLGQPSTSSDAKVVRHDKYINLIRNLIREEGILSQSSLHEDDDGSPLMDKKEGIDELVSSISKVSESAHNVESVGESFHVFEYVNAVQKAEKEGRHGPFNEEDLGLTDIKDDFYTVNTVVPKSMEKCEYKSTKQIRSLEIKHLKGELAAADALSTKSKSSNTTYEPPARDSNSYSDDSQHSKTQSQLERYSPSVPPPIKKSRFSSESMPEPSPIKSRTLSREFLDSIPLPDPIPVSEIPLPPQQPPPLVYKANLSADDAPPGVDDPSNDMSIVLPAPLQYTMSWFGFGSSTPPAAAVASNEDLSNELKLHSDDEIAPATPDLIKETPAFSAPPLALDQIKHAGVPLNRQMSPYLQMDPSIFRTTQPQYIMPEGNEHGKGKFEFALSHIGWAVGSGFFVGCTRGFVPELFNPETRQLSGKPWMTRLVNATVKHGSGYAQPAGTAVFIYSVFEIILKSVRADDDLNSLAAGACAGALFRSPHGVKASGQGAAFGLVLATIWAIVNTDSRQRFREMFHLA